MDEKFLKNAAINSVALLLMVVVISIAISQYSQPKIYANSAVKKDEIADNESKSNLPSLETDEAKANNNLLYLSTALPQHLGDRYLIIKKPINSFGKISIEELYMERSITVTITGLQEEPFNENSLVRMNQGIKFTGMPILELEDTQETLDIDNIIPIIQDIITEPISKDVLPALEASLDPIKGFSILHSKENNTNLYTAQINIQLDNIYAPILYQDEKNIYIDLKRPKDVYEKIIVVDAGHGGKDSGTYSFGEQFYEKDINLSILLYLKEILDQQDIKVYYTRITDQTTFLNPRVNLANDLEADFFISIHCNSNESSQPSGTEVLYNELMQTEKFPSKQLAQISLDEITNITNKLNRGLVDGSEMVIIKKAKMPMALVEIGFMSNQDDLEFMLKDENKRSIASALYKTIVRAYDELKLTP